MQAFVGYLTVFEEVRILLALQALLINVYSKDAGARGNLGRSVFEEFGVVELELADLESHVVDGPVQITFQQSQVPLHRLDGSREVKIETHGHYDVGLEINERPLADILFFFLSEEIYHPGKTWGDRLF